MSIPVAFVARSQRRSRRVALVGLALFVGVAGAMSLSFIAGARRSSSVVDRLFAAAPRYDTTVFGPTLNRPTVLTLPGVQRADPSGYLATNVVSPTGNIVGVDGFTMDFGSPVDAPLRVLQGTMPRRADVLKIIVNEPFARSFHLTVGDIVTVRM